MNNMNMYDILNKFRAISDSPATAAAAEQVEKLNGVKKDRLDEKYQGFEKTVKAVAKNPKVKDPEAVAAAIGRKKYGKEKFQKAAAAGKKLGEGEMDEAVRGTVFGKQGYRAPQTQDERNKVAQTIKGNRAQNRADTRVTGYGNKVAPQRGVASADTGGARGSAVNVDQSGQATDFEPGIGNIDPQAQGYRGALNLGKRSQGKGVAEGEMDEGIVSDIKRGVKAATGVSRVKNAYQKHMSKADAGGGDKERQRAVKALYVGGPDTAEKAYDKAHKEKYGFKPKRTAMDENQTCMECGMYEGDCNCTHEGYMPAEEGNAFSGAVAKAKADGIQKGEKISVGGKQYPLKEKLSARGRKKFAALAPPKDKITFADKIAGAKKEVDEMLGDVAAEALKGAVKGVKKKVEGKGPWPGTSEYKTKFGEPGMKKGEKKKSSSGGEIEKTAKGIKHTAKDRSEEPDTDEPKSGEKRGRGRPKKYGDDKPRQERETAKSRKKDRTAHGQAGFKADKKKDKKEVDEKAVSKKQQRFMGMVHATQKGEKAPSAAVAKVAKSMGKKDAKDFASTKHKGLPEKVKSKKKEESVEETTTSGSVAPSAAKPAKSSGMQFGKGIYDSINRELEKLIAEGMTINMTQSTEGGKQMYVTATDEDVDRLADLLKMSGIERSAPSPEMGMGPEMGPDVNVVAVDDFADEGPDMGAMDENAPDWPTNDQFNSNALQYSGGLNKPKSTGQTTTPVLNRDKRRQGDNMDSMLESRLRAMLAREKQ